MKAILKRRPRAKAPKRRRPLPPVEVYTPERIAQFILNNSVDVDDYADSVKVVRQMGLDPAKIDHDKPIGVR